MFGGSYPGGLASWYRAAYPDASVGSLSSSGVVNPIIDFYQFDEQVSAAIGNKCGTRLKKISRAFDKATEAKDTFKEALRLFECESDMSETDFLYMIADGWSMADQYGSKSKLCSAIMAVPEDSSSDVLMKTYAAFNNDLWGKQFCSQGFYNTAALADPARWETNARSWRWQTCYQVAWFNTAPASGSIRSQKVNLEYHLQQCATVFGEKMVPAINDINRQFGGEMPVAHKVFYSDFADDPWQRASVSYPPAEDQPYSLAMCNDCGHCMDLHAPSESDPVQLQETRNDFKTYLKKWLA